MIATSLTLSSFALATALALSSGLALCHNAPARGNLQGPELQFTMLGSTQQQDTLGPRLLETPGDSVRIEGTISTPNPCYDIAASLSQDDRTLQLKLTATSRGGFCAQVVTNHRYRATITGLTRGAYDIVTVYDYPDTGWDAKEHRLEVEVGSGE